MEMTAEEFVRRRTNEFIELCETWQEEMNLGKGLQKGESFCVFIGITHDAIHKRTVGGYLRFRVLMGAGNREEFPLFFPNNFEDCQQALGVLLQLNLSHLSNRDLDDGKEIFWKELENRVGKIAIRTELRPDNYERGFWVLRGRLDQVFHHKNEKPHLQFAINDANV